MIAADHISNGLFSLLCSDSSVRISLKGWSHAAALHRYVIEWVPARPASSIELVVGGLPELAILPKLIICLVAMHRALYRFLNTLAPLFISGVSIPIAWRLAFKVIRLHNYPVVIIVEEGLLVMHPLTVLFYKRFAIYSLHHHLFLILQCPIQMWFTKLVPQYWRVNWAIIAAVGASNLRRVKSQSAVIWDKWI